MSHGRQVTASDATPLYECLQFKDGRYTVSVIEISDPAPHWGLKTMKVEYLGPKPRKHFTVEIEDTRALLSLKHMIAREMNIPVGSFNIISHGTTITAPDTTSLYKCLTFSYEGGYTVHVIGSPDSSDGGRGVYERERAAQVAELERAEAAVNTARAECTRWTEILRSAVEECERIKAKGAT